MSVGRSASIAFWDGYTHSLYTPEAALVQQPTAPGTHSKATREFVGKLQGAKMTDG